MTFVFKKIGNYVLCGRCYMYSAVESYLPPSLAVNSLSILKIILNPNGQNHAWLKLTADSAL